MPHRACVAACCSRRCHSLHIATAAPPANPAAESARTRPGCFAAGDGYLRARMRGALDLDLDWKNARDAMRGRPAAPGKNGSNGVRVSIGGPAARRWPSHPHGIRHRRASAKGAAARLCAPMSPSCSKANSRIFATQGDDKCTVDSLTQQRVEMLGPGRAVYRVVARGFCLGPATSLSRERTGVPHQLRFCRPGRIRRR